MSVSSSDCVKQFVCQVCHQEFSSRNQLFTHLRSTECSSLQQEQRSRLALLVSYIGDCFHGSERGSARDEELTPTVEGTLMGVIQTTWGVDVVGIDRSARTAKGMHATTNTLVLTVQPALTDVEAAGNALLVALEGTGISLLGLMTSSKGIEGQFPAQLDKVRVACKRIYQCAIPYSILLTPEERREQSQESHSDDIWLCNIPACATSADMLQEILHVEHNVDLEPGAGTAVIRVQGTKATLLRADLHGKLFEGCERGIIALSGREAAVKLAVHRRIKAVLRALRGPTTGQRSFHNFCSPECAATRRKLQHCSSGIQHDVSDSGLWNQSHSVVVSFSAESFAPQQLQRMVGALVAVVRGDEKIECVHFTRLATMTLSLGTFMIVSKRDMLL